METNKTEIKSSKSQENYQKNKEYFKDYQKNSMQAKAARKRYYEKNKDKWIQYSRKYRSTYEGQIKNIFNGLKSRAGSKGLEFDLKITDLVWPAQCPVLDIPILFGQGHNSHNSPSVDRFDNEKGYTKENIKLISYRANTLKSDASKEEIEKILIYLSK